MIGMLVGVTLGANHGDVRRVRAQYQRENITSFKRHKASAGEVISNSKKRFWKMSSEHRL